MYISQQSTDFNQQVDLGNSYCKCFHLMCRVEKSTWYILKKSAALAIDRLKVLGSTTNSLALRGFNTVDRVFFPCEEKASMIYLSAPITKLDFKKSGLSPYELSYKQNKNKNFCARVQSTVKMRYIS